MILSVQLLMIAFIMCGMDRFPSALVVARGAIVVSQCALGEHQHVWDIRVAAA
jgi:hypothetical protein